MIFYICINDSQTDNIMAKHGPQNAAQSGLVCQSYDAC